MKQYATALLVCSFCVPLVGCDAPVTVSGFGPLYPPVEVAKNSLGIATVNSLRPTLIWQRHPSNSGSGRYISFDLDKYNDLRFDLIIWEQVNGARGDIVYRANGLAWGKHTVQKPLKPATVYYWSVRGTFNTGEARRVTDWTISDWPCIPRVRGIHRLLNACGREFARRTGRIPTENYLRFKTPEK